MGNRYAHFKYSPQICDTNKNYTFKSISHKSMWPTNALLLSTNQILHINQKIVINSTGIWTTWMLHCLWWLFKLNYVHMCLKSELSVQRWIGEVIRSDSKAECSILLRCILFNCIFLTLSHRWPNSLADFYELHLFFSPPLSIESSILILTWIGVVC